MSSREYKDKYWYYVMMKVSELRLFTIDTSSPNFISLTTNPSLADDLDPGVNITILANVTMQLSLWGILGRSLYP